MNNLKKIRNKKGLTIKELSLKTNLAESTIARIENGIFKNPGILTLKKIAKALGTTVEELFDFNDKPLARR
ncbi:transcriptional regulator [Marinitoga sp. 1197]|uniref:helix-turn-helix domain-containing protein n=1 Tax=unclassified Marinitoga TaxID=2640159 RepID=UPI0006411FA8|nr:MULTISPECIES: helix-turn-helix transcriptional regulator [unclassified Marinitoga]AJW76950.1 hypothetical protein UF08_61 [Marinitoga camini virus 1]AMS33978.1 hypothetical protein UF09_62 [Marinitoga camini virus 2]KLO23993.1 transcriptional regulator [Marinitoga sp. 1197]KLO24737.1 transcriptional regulator [Marinitoga sp. 1155]